MQYSKKKLWLAGVLILVCLVISTAVLESDRYGVWDRGLSYMFHESHDYMLSVSLDENVYTLEIDLNDLDSNTGKKIYENGDCYIKVGLVHTAHEKNGGYRVIFQSYGVSDYIEGKIVSGLLYHGSHTDLSAKMQTTYNGVTYDCSSCGYGSIGEDNTDTFGFYLFPTEAYETDAVSTESTGTVTVALTNLREHEWRRIENFDFLTRYIN